MAYWCDDRALNLEQRRLDAQSREAERKMKKAAEPAARKAETPKGENDDA